jgi:hypothetical protein
MTRIRTTGPRSVDLGVSSYVSIVPNRSFEVCVPCFIEICVVGFIDRSITGSDEERATSAESYQDRDRQQGIGD